MSQVIREESRQRKSGLTKYSLTINATRHHSFFGIPAKVRAPIPYTSFKYPNIPTVI